MRGLAHVDGVLHGQSQTSLSVQHTTKRFLHPFQDINMFGPMTKVVCTLGPSTDSKEQVEKLVINGMNVARINFSHSGNDYTYPTMLMGMVRNAPGRHHDLADEPSMVICP